MLRRLLTSCSPPLCSALLCSPPRFPTQPMVSIANLLRSPAAKFRGWCTSVTVPAIQQAATSSARTARRPSTGPTVQSSPDWPTHSAACRRPMNPHAPAAPALPALYLLSLLSLLSLCSLCLLPTALLPSVPASSSVLAPPRLSLPLSCLLLSPLLSSLPPLPLLLPFWRFCATL